MTSQTYAYGKRWRYERAHGFTRIVDAARATAHIDDLRAQGWSLRGIADAADVTPNTVSRLARREQLRVHRDSERKILAVRAEDIRGRANADGFVLRVGAQRRIRALIAIGYRHTDITAAMRAALPSVGTNSQMVLHQHGRWVTRAVADAVSTAYDRLAMTPGPSAISRRRAARAGYAPPLAWDDDTIDDPAAQAAEWRRSDNRHTKLPPVEELQFLLDNGEAIAAIALRFGVTEDGVLTALRRHAAA